MQTSDKLSLLSLIISCLVSLIGGFWALREHRAKKKAENEARLAQSELAQVRRRADAPYLKPSSMRFNGFQRELGGGKIGFYPAGMKSMLCEFCEEVAMPDGEEVIFIIEHSGADARSVVCRLDGERIILGREAAMQHSLGLYFLAYPYQKSKHGQPQQLTISFETENGTQDTHRYLTKHGCRVLVRIDPPLPT